LPFMRSVTEHPIGMSSPFVPHYKPAISAVGNTCDI